jgi:hypothetical protein
LVAQPEDRLALMVFTVYRKAIPRDQFSDNRGKSRKVLDNTSRFYFPKCQALFPDFWEIFWRGFSGASTPVHSLAENPEKAVKRDQGA